MCDLCLALWKELLLARGAQLGPKLDLSSLAKVTDGYTQSHILQAIQTVLSSHRLDQQTKRPLTAVEFIPPLARQDPVYKEEEETFKVSFFLWWDIQICAYLCILIVYSVFYKAWYSRSPLGKKRARAARASEEEADLKKGKKKAGKIQKKGKDGKSKMKKKKKK